MSVSPRFSIRNGLFDRCWPSTVPSDFDVIDITPTQATLLFYMLEEHGIQTIGSAVLPGPQSYDIDWTIRFGSTESLPFSPTFVDRSGSYYGGFGGSPATIPPLRACATDGVPPSSVSPRPAFRFFAREDVPGTSYKIVYLQMNLLFSGGTFKLAYSFAIGSGYSSSGASFVNEGVVICNQASSSLSLPTGSAPFTGDVTIAGIDGLLWKGGAVGPVAFPQWTTGGTGVGFGSPIFSFYS